jgi:ABC-type dipeptide/oligopeptide/nickel transport system permease component
MEEEDVIQEKPISEVNNNIQDSQDSKERDSEFPGQEIEHPTLKEASKEDLDEIKKVKPVIVEWKKPFFVTFALAVAAVVLTYILGL